MKGFREQYCREAEKKGDFSMIYGYARCSTNEKKQDIDRQKRDLKKLGVDAQNIFWEYESGTKNDRVQLDRLMNTVHEGDTSVALVCCIVDI